jgi:hypothetical protein
VLNADASAAEVDQDDLEQFTPAGLVVEDHSHRLGSLTVGIPLDDPLDWRS